MDEMLGRAVSPFGRIRPQSTRLPGQDVSPGDLAAGNLVTKALQALAAGDDDRAEQMITRATRLPYDRSEQWWPVLNAASMALFDAVVDAMEESDDDDWLRAAFELLDSVDPVVAETMDQILRIVRQDYPLHHAEERAITRRIGRRGPGREGLPDPWGPEEAPAALAAVTRSLLEGVMAYDRALPPGL